MLDQSYTIAPPHPPSSSSTSSTSPQHRPSLHLLPSASFCFSSSALDFSSSLLNRTWLFTSLSRSSWQDVQEFIAARIISQSVSIKTRLSTKVCVRRNNRRTETEAEPSDCDLQLTFTWHTPIDPDQYSLHSHYVPLTVSLWWCELLNHSQVVWRLHPLWQSDSLTAVVYNAGQTERNWTQHIFTIHTETDRNMKQTVLFSCDVFFRSWCQTGSQQEDSAPRWSTRHTAGWRMIWKFQSVNKSDVLTQKSDY